MFIRLSSRYQPVLAIAMVVSTMLSLSAHAQVKAQVDGEVQAASPCELFPSDSDMLCLQAVVPIQSQIVARSGRASFVLRSDADGHLTGALPKGTYTLRLRQVQYRALSVDASDLSLKPSTLRVSKGRTATATFKVYHRSRGTKNSISRGASR